MSSYNDGQADLAPQPTVQVAASSRGNTRATLLTLPRELRDIIYEYTFDEHIYIPSEDGRVLKKGLDNAALMVVCWQLHDEARPSYYKNTRFISFCSEDIAAWLKCLPPASRNAIRHVVYGGPLELWNVKNCLVRSEVALEKGVVRRGNLSDSPDYQAAVDAYIARRCDGQQR